MIWNQFGWQLFFQHLRGSNAHRKADSEDDFNRNHIGIELVHG